MVAELRAIPDDEIAPDTIAWKDGRQGGRKGATPDGVYAEYKRVVARFGTATVKNSAQAVLEDEEAYPNLRAFGPKSREDAYRGAIEKGIQDAYSSITVVREHVTPKGPKLVSVRLLHAVPQAKGKELAYEALEVVSRSEDKRRYLIGRLRDDAATFSGRLEDTLAEIAELM